MSNVEVIELISPVNLDLNGNTDPVRVAQQIIEIDRQITDAKNFKERIRRFSPGEEVNYQSLGTNTIVIAVDTTDPEHSKYVGASAVVKSEARLLNYIRRGGPLGGPRSETTRLPEDGLRFYIGPKVSIEGTGTIAAPHDIQIQVQYVVAVSHQSPDASYEIPTLPREITPIPLGV